MIVKLKDSGMGTCEIATTRSVRKDGEGVVGVKVMFFSHGEA